MANPLQLSLLELLAAIECANAWKPPKDFLKPFDDFEAAMRSESVRSQLRQAGEAIAAMADHLANYTRYILDENRDAGILFDDDGLGRLVRGSVDFSGLDDLVEAPPAAVFAPYADRAPLVRPDSGESKTDEPEISSSPPVLNLLALAGNDHPTVWSESIRSILSEGESVDLLELSDRLRMPVVEVWIGCLLGGFDLRQVQTTDASFYQAAVMVSSPVIRES